MPTFRFFLRQAGNALLRSPTVTLLSVITIALALSVLATFGVVLESLRHAAEQLGQEVEVSVYFAKDTPAEALAAARAELLELPEVGAARALSSEAAMAEFKQGLGADAALLEGLPQDLLPPSVELSLRADRHWKAAEVTGLAERLRGRPGVEDVRYGQDQIERLSALLSAARIAAIVLGIALCGATVLIVSNTIRLTVYARRDEVEIMSLVGATDAFVRAPFVIEGAIQGLLGALAAILALSLLGGALRLGLERGLAYVTEIHLHFSPLRDAFGLVLAGALLGLAGSMFAVRKVQRVWR